MPSRRNASKTNHSLRGRVGLAASRRVLLTLAAATLLLGCSGPDISGADGGTASKSDLTACERDRLAAALGLIDGAEPSLPLDPADEPLADIARDICALDGGASGPAAAPDTGVRTPAQERDAALPAALVRAPALFDPSDAPPGIDEALDNLWVACGQGSAAACNALLYESSAGSDYEAFAFSCGGRENLHCNVLLGEPGADAGLLGVEFEPTSPPPGNIPELDGWWAACGEGSSRACAQLVLSAPGGSAYASFGWTCGGRTTRDCALLVGDDGVPPALAGRSPHDPPPGDDEYLDQLWERCGAADATACRDLATFGPPGSDYERYALSCGWRAVRACARLFAELSGG